MPELPEVEYAAGVARRVAVGRHVTSVRVLHPSQRRALPVRAARRVAGDRVTAVERRGKYQLLRLASGRTLLVHFRLNGDWVPMQPGDDPPRHARVILDLDDGHALALVDSRALATLALHEAGEALLTTLGPEATSGAFDAAWLERWFGRRRGPVKPALLDQRAVAGIGNIYASEACWYARLDPRAPVHRLSSAQRRALVQGVKRAMLKALDHPERYYGAGAVSDRVRFNVYDRAGAPCRRCGEPILRVTQAGRSTYFCAGCQAPGAAAPVQRTRRAKRPARG